MPEEGINLTKLTLPREWALKVAEAAQLETYAAKNNMMNQLVGKGIDYFSNYMVQANNEIGVN